MIKGFQTFHYPPPSPHTWFSFCLIVNLHCFHLPSCALPSFNLPSFLSSRSIYITYSSSSALPATLYHLPYSFCLHSDSLILAFQNTFLPAAFLLFLLFTASFYLTIYLSSFCQVIYYLLLPSYLFIILLSAFLLPPSTFLSI